MKKKKIFFLGLIVAIVMFLSFLSFINKGNSKMELGISIKNLKVGLVPNFSSYCYKNDLGLPEGLNIDIINAIALEMGVNVELHEIPENEIILSLITGRVDCVYGVDYRHIPDEYIKKSNVFFDNRMSIFITKDNSEIKTINDLRNKKVSVYKNDPYINIIDEFDNIRIFRADNIETAVNLLMYGITDAYVGDKYKGIDYIYNTRYKDRIKTIGDESCRWMSIMVTLRENSELIELANNGYDAIVDKGTFDIIINKWYGESIGKHNKLIGKLLMIGVMLVLLVILAFLIFFRINIMLKREVTDRTKVLNEEKNLKESIIDSIFDGLIYLDANKYIIFANPSAHYILGERQNLINKNLFSLENAYLFNKEKLENAIKNKSKIIKEENKVTGPEGNKYIEYSLTPVLKENGDIKGITLTFKDVTDEKYMMQKLINKDKLESLGRLTAGIAHEIRNPLTAVSMYVNLLPQKIDSEAFRNQILEDIPREIKRLDNIIKNLLDYAKPVPSKKEKLNLNNEIHAIIRLLINQLNERRIINLDIKIDKNIFIFFDRQQLKQIIINIIINSMDELSYIEKPCIRIKGFYNNDKINLEIFDNGRGVPEELAMNIFEPFFSNKSNGYGLGLSIVEQLVKENSSEIILDTTYMGGAKFIIYIPIVF